MSWRHHDMTLTSHRDFYHLSHLSWNQWYRLDPGVDSTISEAEELENNETINVELTRDLESYRDVTISMTCRISTNTNATDSILVSMPLSSCVLYSIYMYSKSNKVTT